MSLLLCVDISSVVLLQNVSSVLLSVVDFFLYQRFSSYETEKIPKERRDFSYFCAFLE